MNILMMTNTFTPHVGGVARSVSGFTQAFRRRGHRVLVVAPEFPGTPAGEEDVIRIPAIQQFNGSDFSVRLPIPGYLDSKLKTFHPDVVHSHHPFLIGDSALRIAIQHKVPLVFTHHTMYEEYTHYVPGDSPGLKRFVVSLSTGYANLCDLVIAPSQSVAEELSRRGVRRPIRSIPTGVDTRALGRGDGAGFRRRHGIMENQLVVGHAGRLAPEKNLEFLAQSVAGFLKSRDGARLMVVGCGPSETAIRSIFAQAGLENRLDCVGRQMGQDLIDAYHAMDVFAFASKSETQGMVVVEAMAAGLPVVALDAPGVREVVSDGVNGRLLPEESMESFARALSELASLPKPRRTLMREAALQTAKSFSMDVCAERMLEVYEGLIGERAFERGEDDHTFWISVLDQIRGEWDLIKNMAEAAADALASSEENLSSGRNE